MFGLELLMVGMLNLAPTPVVAQIECRMHTAPKINVLPSKSRIKYDFSKTKAELNNVDVDTVSPYGPNHKSTVSGLMSGSIQVEHQVAFIHESYDQLGQGCVYLKSVEVKVNIDPTVYIAREYPEGTCMHHAVLNHERKHIREDQLIVNKYSNYIGRALATIVDSKGASFGPYDLDDLPDVQKNIQEEITQVIKKFNGQMNLERQERQQEIDNVEEYASIGRQCRHQSQ